MVAGRDDQLRASAQEIDGPAVAVAEMPGASEARQRPGVHGRPGLAAGTGQQRIRPRRIGDGIDPMGAGLPRPPVDQPRRRQEGLGRLPCFAVVAVEVQVGSDQTAGQRPQDQADGIVCPKVLGTLDGVELPTTIPGGLGPWRDAAEGEAPGLVEGEQVRGHRSIADTGG